MTDVIVKGKRMAVASIEGNVLVLTNGDRIPVTDRTLNDVKAQMPQETEPEEKPDLFSKWRKAK